MSQLFARREHSGFRGMGKPDGHSGVRVSGEYRAPSFPLRPQPPRPAAPRAPARPPALTNGLVQPHEAQVGLQRARRRIHHRRGRQAEPTPARSRPRRRLPVPRAGRATRTRQGQGAGVPPPWVRQDLQAPRDGPAASAQHGAWEGVAPHRPEVIPWRQVAAGLRSDVSEWRSTSTGSEWRCGPSVSSNGEGALSWSL